MDYYTLCHKKNDIANKDYYFNWSWIHILHIVYLWIVISDRETSCNSRTRHTNYLNCLLSTSW